MHSSDYREMLQGRTCILYYLVSTEFYCFQSATIAYEEGLTRDMSIRRPFTS